MNIRLLSSESIKFIILYMPSKSKKQQTAMCMALAARKGDLNIKELKGAALDIYNSDMTNREIKDFTRLKEDIISLKDYIKENIKKKYIMKTIKEYLNDKSENLILESFHCDLLRKIEKQAKSEGTTFNKVMYYMYAWDKITNADIETYPKGSLDMSAIKKLLRSGLVFYSTILSNGDEIIVGVFNTWNSQENICRKLSDYVFMHYKREGDPNYEVWKKLSNLNYFYKDYDTLTATANFLNRADVLYYIPDASNFKTSGLKMDRQDSKVGFVPTNDKEAELIAGNTTVEDWLNKLRDENISRYKDMLMQKKALKSDKYDECCKLIENLSNVANTLYKNALSDGKYSGKMYKIKDITTRLFDLYNTLNDIAYYMQDIKDGSHVQHSASRVEELYVKIINRSSEIKDLIRNI